jgi:hypothetical protein
MMHLGRIEYVNSVDDDIDISINFEESFRDLVDLYSRRNGRLSSKRGYQRVSERKTRKIYNFVEIEKNVEAINMILKPLDEAVLSGRVISDDIYAACVEKQLQKGSVSNFVKGLTTSAADSFLLKLELYNRLMIMKNKWGLVKGTDNETIELINALGIDLDIIIGTSTRHVYDRGYDRETAFTKVFWQDIIARREKVENWKDALWNPKTERGKQALKKTTGSDLVQLNYNHGIGDITYVNFEGEIVIIEVKRAGAIYVLHNRTVIAGRDTGRNDEITKDIVNLTIWAGGEKFLPGSYKTGDDFVNSFVRWAIEDVKAYKKVVEIPVQSDFVIMTPYRLVDSSIPRTAVNRWIADNTPPDTEKVPYIGLHAQWVSMNEFLAKGRERRLQGWNWINHISKRSFIPFTVLLKDVKQNLGVKIQGIMTNFKAKIKGKGHTRFKVMGLFDLFVFID